MLHFFWRHMRRGEGGFTLIELLIVVAIIAILAAILIPNFLRARKQSQISATKGNLKNIGTAMESYFVDNAVYPAGGTSGLAPLYMRAVPSTPVGTAYQDDVSTDGQDYWVCDDDTDTLDNLAWYYTPAGGLASGPASTCPAAL